MPPAHTVLAALLLLYLGPALAQSQPDQPAAPASGAAMQVTTDTAEYCDTLADRVARAERQRRDALPQAEALAEEGQMMCHAGLIRGGLVRLRRALMLLRQD